MSSGCVKIQILVMIYDIACAIIRAFAALITGMIPRTLRTPLLDTWYLARQQPVVY